MELAPLKAVIRRLTAFSLLLCTGIASATTYYVDPNGSDGASGDAAHPFATIPKATMVSAAGDTIIVNNGLYHVVDTAPNYYAWNFKPHGTATDWVRIVAAPGAHPVIDCSGYTHGDPVTITPDGSADGYLSIDGLTFTGSNAIGLSVYGVNHVELKNIKVSGAVGSGIYGSGSSGITDLTVVGCEVTSCSATNSSLTAGTWPPALFIDRVTGVTIHGCNVHENYGEGIGLRRATTAEVSGNTVWDNFSVNIYLDNSHYTNVFGNTVYATENTNYYRTVGGIPRQADGIGVAQETISGWTTTPMEYIHIYDNNLYRNHIAVYFSDYQSGAMTSATNCYVNDCYGYGNGSGLFRDTNKQGVTDSGNTWH